MDERNYQKLLESLAANIKTHREYKKLTQEELALKSDIDRTFISKIERKKANPSLKTLSDIAETLDIPLIDLLTNKGINNDRTG